MERAASHPTETPRSGRAGDRIFRVVLTVFGLTVLTVPAVMLVELALASRLALGEFGLSFLVRSIWDPVREQFGDWPFIYGTVVSSLIALALAVPVSLGLAVFLSDLAPHRIRTP